MKRFWVKYSEHRIMEILVKAEDEHEARIMVENGGADYNEANELDAEITSVNSVTFADEGFGDD